MADNSNNDTSLKQVQQVNAALEKQNRLLETNVSLFNSQLELAKQMLDLIGQVQKSLPDPNDAKRVLEETSRVFKEKLKDGKKDINEVVKDATDGMDDIKKSTKGVNEALKDAAKRYPVMRIAAISAAHGVVEGFRAAIAITQSFAATTLSLVSGIGKIGLAILSIPFKIFQGLIDKAESGGGGNELAAAYEAVRKQFGSFREEAAHNVIATARSIDKEFTQTGLNTFRVFGMLHERLELVNKTATAMGAVFDVVGKQFAEDAGYILAYQKGLGLSEEEMKDLGQASIRTGIEMKELGRQIFSIASSMTKQLGGSTKLYTRDVGKMINDVKHFGGVSVKTMVETAVYTRKLGIETEKLLGMLDKFDTFDDAAQSAAKLAQTYGANIDALKLMNAESPAEQLDMIRKAMLEAGKSADDLTRKDFKYIASLTGLDEKTVGASLALKNQGVSLDKVREAGVKAEKQQLSQADAMAKLADSIERLTPSGGSHFGGFINALIKGFNDGIEWSDEFRQTMVNIRIDLQKMYWAGRQIGTDFVKFFPGVKDILGGIRDLFDPNKFQKLTQGLIEVFRQFFKDMTERPGVALPKLMETLRAKFFDFFNSQGGSGSKIMNGMKSFFTAMRVIFAAGVKFLLESMRDGFSLITDLISGKGLNAQVNAEAGASNGKKFVLSALRPIIDAFVEVGPSLKDAFVKLMNTLWDEIKASKVVESIMAKIQSYLTTVASVSLGSGLAKGFMTGVGSWAAKTIIEKSSAGLSRLFGGAASEAVAAGEKAAGSAAASAGKNGIKSVSAALPDAKAAGEAADKVKNLDKLTPFKSKMASIATSLVGLAGVIGIGMVAVWGAIKLFGDVDAEKIAKGMAVVVGATTAMLPAAGVVAILGKFPTNFKTALTGLAAMAAVVVGMTGTVGLLYGAFSAADVDLGKLSTFSKALVEISKIFILSGPVVLESMVVGAALALTGGVGGAAAVAGFGVLAATVSAMAGAAGKIIADITAQPFDPGQKDKIDTFVKVMGFIGDFAKTFNETLKEAKPSISELVFGKADKASELINSLAGYVKTIVGPPGGLSDLIKQMMNGATELAKGGPAATAAAQVFSSMLIAVGELAKSLVPPAETQSSMFTLIETGDKRRNEIQGMADYVRTMEGSLAGLIDRVQRFVKDLTSGPNALTDESVKRVAGLSNVFGFLTTVISNLRPSPELISSLKGVDPDKAASILNAAGDVSIKTGLALRGVMDSIKDSITPLLDSLKVVPTEAQIKTLAVVMPIISTALNFTAAMATMISSLTTDKFKMESTARLNLIASQVSGVTMSIGKVGEQLPGLIKTVNDAISGIKISGDPKEYADKIARVKAIMEVAASVSSIVPTGAGGRTAVDFDSFAKSVIDPVFGKYANGATPIGVVVDVVSQGLASIDDTKLKDLNKLPKLSDVLSKVSSFSSGFITAADTVKDTTVEAVQQPFIVISEMIKKVQELSDLLSDDKLTKIDIRPKLTTLAASVGLGGKGTYSIEHKPFTVTVNLDVHMDTKQIEHALVDRHGTSLTFNQQRRSQDI